MKTPWGEELVVIEQCPSTMDEAEELARAGAATGSGVVARRQTAGRGRRGKIWLSVDGDGLNLSLVLRPTIAPAQAPPMTLAVGVAVAKAVQSFGVDATLKWPNDILVSGRKLAGILLEMSTHRERLRHVIVGVGLNLSAVPGGLETQAVSLSEAAGGPVSRDDCIMKLLEEVYRWTSLYTTVGMSEVAGAWRELAEFGQSLQIDGRKGIAVALSESGELIVEDRDGERWPVSAGEILWG